MDFGNKKTVPDLCMSRMGCYINILTILKHLFDSADTDFFTIHFLILNISEAFSLRKLTNKFKLFPQF